MIPKPVKRLLVEIAGKATRGRYYEATKKAKYRREIRKNPEKCLTAFLWTINEELSRAISMLSPSSLGGTVEDSFSEDTLAEADRLLRRHKSRKVNGKRRNKKAIAVARYYLNPLD